MNLLFWRFFRLIYPYTTFKRVAAITTHMFDFNVRPYYYECEAGTPKTRSVWGASNAGAKRQHCDPHHTVYKFYISRKVKISLIIHEHELLMTL